MTARKRGTFVEEPEALARNLKAKQKISQLATKARGFAFLLMMTSDIVTFLPNHLSCGKLDADN